MFTLQNVSIAKITHLFTLRGDSPLRIGAMYHMSYQIKIGPFVRFVFILPKYNPKPPDYKYFCKSEKMSGQTLQPIKEAKISF